ncbi:MAG: hypothetical protein OXC91_03335, partial [Rhodobacteraceae bacterium]|nr:hypothetical protein [Paracoccaceae bacterium]
MSIQNLQVWYGTSSVCLDLSEQIAGQLQVNPKLSVDSDIYGGSNVPATIAVGCSFMVSCQGAFYADTLDAMATDTENGWLAVADPQADIALVTPAALVNRPRDAGTYDPARVIRTALMFEPPETAGVAYNAPPGLSGP